jgi:hypothetical protein
MHRFWGAMQETAPPFQQIFHDLLAAGLPDRLRASPLLPLYETAVWAEVIEALRSLRPVPGLAAALAIAPPAPETLVIAEVEALWSAIDRADDWTPLAARIDDIRRTGTFNRALGLLSGPNARPGHLPLG